MAPRTLPVNLVAVPGYAFASRPTEGTENVGHFVLQTDALPPPGSPPGSQKIHAKTHVIVGGGWEAAFIGPDGALVFLIKWESITAYGPPEVVSQLRPTSDLPREELLRKIFGEARGAELYAKEQLEEREMNLRFTDVFGGRSLEVSTDEDEAPAPTPPRPRKTAKQKATALAESAPPDVTEDLE